MTISKPLIAPAPDFDHPLEMLAACHGRIRAQCATLTRLLAHLPRHGSDTPAQHAARAVLRYFDTAGINHHEDEERDLFPRLFASPRMRAADRTLLDELAAEHRAMRAEWDALRPALACIAAGEAATLDKARTDRFCALYAIHMEKEERRILPLAAEILDTAALATIGTVMSQRRGVKPKRES